MEIQNRQAKKFEDIRHVDENGNEFWLARELQEVLGYAKWQRFSDAINRAMVSCKLNEQEPLYHFANAVKMVDMPIGDQFGQTRGFADVGKTPQSKQKVIPDYRLTRFACSKSKN